MSLSVAQGIAADPAGLPLSQEDQARADLYALLAHLLLAPPGANLLAELANAGALAAEDSGNPLDQSWEKLVMAAAITEADAIREEFDELFTSTGTPRVNPYASLYISGFLNEKPLAALRSELSRLGLVRAHGSGELEDHLAALCEAMRIMITGAQAAKPQPIMRQKDFFQAHIEPWYSRCLHDIRVASAGRFYALVADFAQAYLDIEKQAFEIADLCDLDTGQV